VFLLIPCSDSASIFTSRLICACSRLRGMSTPFTSSESLSQGTFAFIVIFLTAFVARANWRLCGWLCRWRLVGLQRVRINPNPNIFMPHQIIVY